jgi:hypothetical protein
MSSDEHPWQIVYVMLYIFATVAIICSISSLIFIWNHRNRRGLVTKLLFYIHFSLLIEELCVLPFIYNDTGDFCKFVGFLQIYSGLSNIMAMGVLVLYFVNYLTSYSGLWLSTIAKYKEFVIFCFPLITLLPFSTNSYGEAFDVFCGLPSDNPTQSLWAILVLHLWLWLVILFSIVLLGKVLYKTMKVDSNIAKKIFTTVGIYLIVTMLAWIERSVPRLMQVSDNDFQTPRLVYYLMVFNVYIISMVYALLLYLDPTVVDQSKHEFSVDSGEHDSNLTLQWDDLSDVMSSQNASQISNVMEQRSSSMLDGSLGVELRPSALRDSIILSPTEFISPTSPENIHNEIDIDNEIRSPMTA